MNIGFPLLARIEPVVIVVIVISVVVVFVNFLFSRLLQLWLQAWLSGVPVEFMQLLGMRFRKVDPQVIVHHYIMAAKANVKLTTAVMEAHYLGGGDVPAVVRTMIAMQRAKVGLTWDVAAEIDLAGYDVHATAEAALKDNLDAVTFEYAKKRGFRKHSTHAIGER